jgi:hypothetical protein
MPPLTTICCETTAGALWLLLGSGMITAALIYVRRLIRRSFSDRS